MSDDDDSIGSYFGDIREVRQQEGRTRREIALAEFEVSRAALFAERVTLRMHDETHYSMHHPDGWLLNVYPGNCRIFADRNKARAPYLKLAGKKWGLPDVVAAVISALTPVKGSN